MEQTETSQLPGGPASQVLVRVACRNDGGHRACALALALAFFVSCPKFTLLCAQDIDSTPGIIPSCRYEDPSHTLKCAGWWRGDSGHSSPRLPAVTWIYTVLVMTFVTCGLKNSELTLCYWVTAPWAERPRAADGRPDGDWTWNWGSCALHN